MEKKKTLLPIHGQTREIYAELDAEIAAIAPVCEISGRCCRFQEYGHRLYFSKPEAEILLQEGTPEGSTNSLESCPFQINNLCTAREKRPLGCRVYFCDPTYQETCLELSEKYIARMKQLHEQHDQPWDYRSLHAWLERFDETDSV